ncbi:MAG: methionyl-tRNA formyltransferase [Epsilonproteobacteria bacterium]|nr:methionyl-tRNA formyltransferase [Campylobacterota bacterium]
MRIVFMGSPEYAVKILKALDENFEVVAVYTQPDKPVGRKKELRATPVKGYAKEKGIEVFTPQTLKNEDLSRFKPDFIVVAAYGILLPKSVLDVAPCINLHASLLPKHRGASPIQAAILNGDKYTGVTSMLMDEGLDTGDILVWDYTEVGRKTNIELFNELGDMAAKQIVYTINNFNSIKPLPQIDALSSYSPKIKKEDGYVDFKDAGIMDRKYRAFLGWPGIYCDKFKIKQMSLVDTESVNQKGVIKAIESDGVIVGCEKGSVKLQSIQIPGKKEISAVDYINGQRLKAGEKII